MYLLGPIAKSGLDVRITGGVDTGCLRVQAAINSDIKTVKDLKGKKIAVPTHLYSPPHMFAMRVLSAQGMDPRDKREGGAVEWVSYPPDVLGKQVEEKAVDAIAPTDPIGTILVGAGKVRTIADQAEDDPYKDEFCCVVVVSGQLVEKNPEAAAKVTRALLKASKWAQTNPTAAANLSVEKGYLASSAKMNAQALSKLRHVPGVDQCRRSILQAADQMKKARLLEDSVDPEKLTKQAWLDLDGVTDKWRAGVQVQRVGGGGPPPRLSREEFAAFLVDPKACSTCCCCAK
jgi:NitT/TauT family transport system substrate-binding protein